MPARRVDRMIFYFLSTISGIFEKFDRIHNDKMGRNIFRRKLIKKKWQNLETIFPNIFSWNFEIVMFQFDFPEIFSVDE